MRRLLWVAALVALTSGCDAEQIIRAVWREEPEHVVREAIAVAECESGLDPSAQSPGGHAGLFQLAPRYHADRLGRPVDLFNAGDNAAVALDLWREQSWRPWTCRSVLR